MLTFGSPPASDLEVDVTDEQVAFFAENGYLALDRLTTDEELEWLRTAYDALESKPRTGFPDGVFDVMAPYGALDDPSLGQLLFPERHVEGVRDTAMYRNGSRIASRLLGVASTQLEQWGHLLFKPPQRGSATPWHQDEAYWQPELSYHAVGTWMPLDDADVDNGCLWFLPGSHKRDVYTHKHTGDDPAVHILELVEPVDVSDAVAVPLPAGAVSFHHPRTLHCSRANTTDRLRRAWANEYQTAPVQLDVPPDRPWVGEGHQALIDAFATRNPSRR